MRKEYLGYKRIAIPIITMALIISSWMPSMNVGNFIGEHRDGVAIVEMYNSEALAATVDYNKVQKTYNVKVFMDSYENEIKFTKSSGRPFIALNRTFVPYRVIGEALGAKVDWDESLRKVTATGNGNKVEMYIGHKTYGVNGEVKQMDVEPFILASEGRTYIPARYVAEGLSYKIDFAQKDGQMYVMIFTKGQTDAEIQELLKELVADEPTPEQKPTVIPNNPNQGIKQGDGWKTPPAAEGSYKQEGNHYTLNGSFDGVWETDKYHFRKSDKYIGPNWGKVSIVEIRVKGGSGKITCTSHPELNYMKKSSGYVQDRSAVSGYWSLMNHGYDIEVTKGMTIDLECSNGDTFTLTI